MYAYSKLAMSLDHRSAVKEGTAITAITAIENRGLSIKKRIGLDLELEKISGAVGPIDAKMRVCNLDNNL